MQKFGPRVECLGLAFLGFKVHGVSSSWVWVYELGIEQRKTRMIMYIYIYICIYAYVCIHMRTEYVHTRDNMCACIRLHTYVMCVYVYTFV